MKHFFPFLFLLIIVFNVAFPLIEQLWDEDAYEVMELSPDDLDEEGETEKEASKEKYEKEPTLPVSTPQFVEKYLFGGLNFAKTSFAHQLLPDLGIHTSSPDLPPEA